MTPRQPIRDHISRVLGANSLLETGNMGFGKRAVLYSLSDSLFSFFLEKEAFAF